jgi:hypothetical protein
MVEGNPKPAGSLQNRFVDVAAVVERKAVRVRNNRWEVRGPGVAAEKSKQ